MSLLIKNTYGTSANTGGIATPVANRDPVFVQNNLLTTVYAWATTWGGAQVQIYVCPQCAGSAFPPVWFPVGDPITQNNFFTFQHRWGQIKAEVINATSDTTGLFADVFTGL